MKEDSHNTITDTRLIEDGYNGFDSKKDTDEEMATASRCGPDVFTRREERLQVYIQFHAECSCRVKITTKIVYNVKAASFVPLCIPLAMEFNSFEEEERGGLLVEEREGATVFHRLLGSSGSSSYDESRHQLVDQLVDTTFLAVFIRLRRSGYFLKEDSQQYEFVREMCREMYMPGTTISCSDRMGSFLLTSNRREGSLTDSIYWFRE